MKVRSGEISRLQFDLYTKPTEHGNAAYLQAKHFDDWGNQTDEIDTFIQIDQKNESHLLEVARTKFGQKYAEKLRKMLGMDEKH